MKEALDRVVVVVAVLLLTAVFAGCQSTVTSKSNTAFAIGTALAAGYSAQGGQLPLTPEQVKIAKQAVSYTHLTLPTILRV